MILLIGGEKGGAGKSTLACNLATFLSCNNKDILLVDADPQKSSSVWAERRNKVENLSKIHCVEKTGNICEAILDFNKRYEYVIIDTGGRDSKELRSALVVAEVFYTPIKPSQIDIDTLGKMNDLVEQALSMNRTLKSFSIITHAPTNPNMDDEKEARDILDKIPNFIPSNVIVKYRSSYWRTMGNGISVIEYCDKKAADEINKLGEEVFKL
jgi:chromosome partitioning protein